MILSDSWETWLDHTQFQAANFPNLRSSTVEEWRAKGKPGLCCPLQNSLGLIMLTLICVLEVRSLAVSTLWNLTNHYPRKKIREEHPLSPDPVPRPASEWRAKWSSLEPLFIIGTGEISTQIRSWNFPQLFCFQPISHLAQMPGLKPKEWNLSCLRLRSLFRHTRP